MELPCLIEALTDPRAYPYLVGPIEVRQTHISAVFLAGDYVYKVKKPVDLGFLDFSTLEKRQHVCQEEVRLNRRLAPNVYLGVVPIVHTPGGLRLEGEGELIDWAVKMRRVPDEATLLQRVRCGQATTGLVEAFGCRLAAFHRTAEANEHIASFGRFEVVSRLMLDIFDQAAPSVGMAVSQDIFDRTRSHTEESLARLRPLIESRAARGVPRNCHGDLHLDHVYCFPEQTPPHDLVIIDCIEFNERFRFMDPVADMAFAAMDLNFLGRRDLTRAFAEAYFRATGDEDGRPLLPLYTAYRATVRGMVEGVLLREKEVPEIDKAAARTRARAHWLMALSELERPERRPCLLLVTGLPGTGKSMLAQALGESAGFDVIRSDVVRKELAGLPASEPSPPALREDLYSPSTTDRTYDECLRRTEGLLAEGRRVIVDATFREERQRRHFLNAAVQSGVPAVIVVCETAPETIRQRLRERKGDASDADWSVYLEVARNWDEPGPDVRRVLHSVSTEGSIEAAVARTLAYLRQLGLFEQ